MVTVELQPGNYYALVEGWSSAEGEYTLPMASSTGDCAGEPEITASPTPAPTPTPAPAPSPAQQIPVFDNVLAYLDSVEDEATKQQLAFLIARFW